MHIFSKFPYVKYISLFGKFFGNLIRVITTTKFYTKVEFWGILSSIIFGLATIFVSVKANQFLEKQTQFSEDQISGRYQIFGDIEKSVAAISVKNVGTETKTSSMTVNLSLHITKIDKNMNLNSFYVQSTSNFFDERDNGFPKVNISLKEYLYLLRSLSKNDILISKIVNISILINVYIRHENFSGSKKEDCTNLETLLIGSNANDDPFLVRPYFPKLLRESCKSELRRYVIYTLPEENPKITKKYFLDIVKSIK